jgi:hypothetical protein
MAKNKCKNKNRGQNGKFVKNTHYKIDEIIGNNISAHIKLLQNNKTERCTIDKTCKRYIFRIKLSGIKQQWTCTYPISKIKTKSEFLSMQKKFKEFRAHQIKSKKAYRAQIAYGKHNSVEMEYEVMTILNLKESLNRKYYWGILMEPNNELVLKNSLYCCNKIQMLIDALNQSVYKDTLVVFNIMNELENELKSCQMYLNRDIDIGTLNHSTACNSAGQKAETKEIIDTTLFE